MKINKIIIIGGLGVSFLTACSLKAQADDPSASMFAKQSEFKDLINNMDMQEDLTHKQWGNKNPFVVPSVTKRVSKTRNYVLEGIFLGSSKPSAIINGVVVGTGDKVEDVKVAQINDDNVVIIDSEGMRKVLSLKL